MDINPQSNRLRQSLQSLSRPIRDEEKVEKKKPDQEEVRELHNSPEQGVQQHPLPQPIREETYSSEPGLDSKLSVKNKALYNSLLSKNLDEKLQNLLILIYHL